MPSSQTRVYDLEKKIGELQVREQTQGIGIEAELQLAFLRKWRELAGKDWIVVVRPRGVIRKPGEVVKARMVEVYDQVAADMIVFGPKRGEPARLATPEECQLWRDYEQANQDAHRKVIAGAQARTAMEGVNALMGQMGATAVGGAPQAAPLPAPTVDLVEPGENPDDLVPEVGTSPAPGAEPEKQDSPAEPGSPTALAEGGLDPDMEKLGSEKDVKALLEAGYSSVEQVAEAEQSKLTEIHGIGPSTAAKLTVEAAEIIAAREAQVEADQAAAAEAEAADKTEGGGGGEPAGDAEG
jgi:hypothetical protein